MTVHKSAKCIPPEGRRQVCLMQHRCNAFRDGSVGSLCNSILVGFISECMLPLDTSSVAKGLPLIRHVLSSLIISQCFDGGALLVLSICFKLLECSKCITLLLQWINSPVSAVVINEGDPVSVAMSGLDRQRTMDISVYELKRCSSSVSGCLRYIDTMLFAC